jgi:hypothetical protein
MRLFVWLSADSLIRRLGLVLSAMVLVGLGGCSESNPLASATLYPVKGRVVLPDGKPLTAGKVVFVAAKTTVTSTAIIDSDGTFVFKGSGRDGLPDGDYLVRLEVDESKLPPMSGKPGTQPKATLPFPQKYLDEDASDLKATVKPDASGNDFEFKLNNNQVEQPQAGGRKGER